MKRGLFTIATALILGLAPSSALLARGGWGYGGYGPGWGMGPGMMWGWGGYGPGFGYGFGGMFMGILFLIVIGVVIYFIVRNAKTRGGIFESERPLDILKKRYARGEITKDEYDRMKDDLR
jgi:putative membrane protein